jgi:hypothetical protein
MEKIGFILRKYNFCERRYSIQSLNHQTPRLCRGGSKSLTLPAVVYSGNRRPRESRGSWSSGTPAPPSHSLASAVIVRFPAGARAIGRTPPSGPSATARSTAPLNCLMMQPARPSYRKRRVFPIGRNIRARSTRSASLVPRLRDRYRFADARCHPAMTL